MNINRIRKLCDDNNLTFASLEREVELPNNSIRRWANSEPSIDKVQKVADFFECTTDYLLGNADNQKSVLWTDVPEEMKTVGIEAVELMQEALDKGFTKKDIQKMIKMYNEWKRADEDE